MNIAFIIPAFLPARDYGGPLTNMIHVGEEFVRLGHKVTVYTSDASSLRKFNQGLKKVEEINGMTIKRFPILTNIKGYWITPSMFRQLLKDDFDIMHIWCMRCFQGEIASFVSLLKNKPLFVHAGGSMGSYQNPTITKSQKILHYIHNPMDMFVMKISKKLIAANNFEKQTFQKFKINDKKIIIIPDGFNSKEFDNDKIDIKNELGLKRDDIILLSVGRLNKIKGLDILVNAFEILENKIKGEKKLKLLIIGRDDNYINDLKRIISKNKFKDNIILLENKSREFIISSYHQCNIFLIPSYYETSPATILEAFVCKKPVIGTNVGGIPEMIESGKNGLLIEPANPEQLANEILFLINNEEIQNKFGINAFQEIQKYDISKIAQNLLKLYANYVLKKK